MFEILTPRLRIRPATADDASYLADLWNDGRVMRFVGFPAGLDLSEGDVLAQLAAEPEGVLNRRLMVETRAGEVIGQAKLGAADDEGVAYTDVKLHPHHWRQGYGTEIKRALVDWQFTHTSCLAVQGTPNKLNVASIRMQEAVGGRRVKEGVFRFAPDDPRQTCDVPYYEYRVFREDWEKQRADTQARP